MHHNVWQAQGYRNHPTHRISNVHKTQPRSATLIPQSFTQHMEIQSMLKQKLPLTHQKAFIQGSMESISHHSLQFGTSKPMMRNEMHIWLKYYMNTKLTVT